MSATPRSRLVNPLLGTYFGIFLSLIVGAVLLLVILEQLGVTDRALRLSMLLGILGLFTAIGIAAFTQLPAEFFASGRRVPAFFNGLILSSAALSGTGLAGFAGTMFLAGFDALSIGVGVVAGMVGMALLIMPFLRKFGAYSVPGYLGRRFDSSAVRTISAALVAVPLLLLLVAELKTAAMIGAWLTQLSGALVLVLVAGSLVLVTGAGGMRASTWSSAALTIAALVALMVPVTIVAVLTTNLPIPQMSHGPVLRALMRTEASQPLPVPLAAAWGFELPGPDMTPIVRRFTGPFGSLGPAAFVFTILALMIGIAGSPGLLSRSGTAPGVHEARKSLGWAVLIAGVVVMTLSSVGVFMRDIFMSQLVGGASENLPDWFRSLMTLDVAGLNSNAPAGSPASFQFKRDLVLLALPVAAGCPAALVYFSAAGIAATAVAGASTCLTALGTILAEDVINAPNSELSSNASRVISARAAVLLTTLAAGWMAVAMPGDPLELFLWSTAMSGSFVFPVLLLSVWWKRTTAWGAVAGLICGFSVAAICIMTGELAGFGLPGALAAVVAAPASFAATLIASILTPAPDRHVLEIVRDMRIPGGETLYDREVRLALLQRRQRA